MLKIVARIARYDARSADLSRDFVYLGGINPSAPGSERAVHKKRFRDYGICTYLARKIRRHQQALDRVETETLHLHWNHQRVRRGLRQSRYGGSALAFDPGGWRLVQLNGFRRARQYRIE